jgi:hypothetical protein
MTTGLFSHRTTGPGRNFLNARRAAQTAKRNAHLRRDIGPFAEAIDDGATLKDAGKVIGVNHQRASQLFRRMREELGWQAQ